MKKIFALILAVALSATVLAGCQSGGDARPVKMRTIPNPR